MDRVLNAPLLTYLGETYLLQGIWLHYVKIYRFDWFNKKLGRSSGWGELWEEGGGSHQFDAEEAEHAGEVKPWVTWEPVDSEMGSFVVRALILKFPLSVTGWVSQSSFQLFSSLQSHAVDLGDNVWIWTFIKLHFPNTLENGLYLLPLLLACNIWIMNVPL